MPACEVYTPFSPGIRSGLISAAVVGLTGGIATGKSTVSRLLREEHHVPIIDADILARQVVEPGTRGYEKIVEAFGEEVVLQDGSGGLDRKKLGEIVFADEGKRRVLNGIVHPEVRWEMLKEVVRCWWRGESWVVLDVPLLIESGIYRWVGEVVVVYWCVRVRWVCVVVLTRAQSGTGAAGTADEARWDQRGGCAGTDRCADGNRGEDAVRDDCVGQLRRRGGSAAAGRRVRRVRIR